jgi:L-malate glycosyltransferase
MSSSALTVVLGSTQRHWHGGEEQARLLAIGLRRRGCRCIIMARRDSDLAQRLAAENFEVLTFPGNGRGPTALWRNRRRLRQLRPDVLHFNDPHAMIALGLAAWSLPIHARIASRRVSYPIRSPRSYRWLCDLVACVSRDVRQVCFRSGLPESMLRVVPDGVDPLRVRSGDRQRGRRSLGLADDQVLLLNVASLTEPKGHRFLLDALPAVIARFPRALLALAGNGELRESLTRQAARLGISDHVRMLGYRHDVPDLIQASDLFVLPSLSEGMCSTLIDVMLADRPIVTTTAGGIPDVVGGEPSSPAASRQPSEENCEPLAWTAPPGDPQAMADAIIRALSSPERCATLLRLACQRAESLFTADHMVEATLAIYREAISRRTSDCSNSKS